MEFRWKLFFIRSRMSTSNSASIFATNIQSWRQLRSNTISNNSRCYRIYYTGARITAFNWLHLHQFKFFVTQHWALIETRIRWLASVVKNFVYWSNFTTILPIRVGAIRLTAVETPFLFISRNTELESFPVLFITSRSNKHAEPFAFWFHFFLLAFRRFDAIRF